MLTRSLEKIYNPMRNTGYFVVIYWHEFVQYLKQTKGIDVSLFEVILKKKYIETKFTLKYISIFFIF